MTDKIEAAARRLARTLGCGDAWRTDAAFGSQRDDDDDLADTPSLAVCVESGAPVKAGDSASSWLDVKPSTLSRESRVD